MSEKKTFEESMSRLDEIVTLLERNDVELEKAIALFEEGLDLAHKLDSQLRGFEDKVSELLNQSPEPLKEDEQDEF